MKWYQMFTHFGTHTGRFLLRLLSPRRFFFRFFRKNRIIISVAARRIGLYFVKMGFQRCNRRQQFVTFSRYRLNIDNNCTNFWFQIKYSVLFNIKKIGFPTPSNQYRINEPFKSDVSIYQYTFGLRPTRGSFRFR